MTTDNRLHTDDSMWPILIHETIGVPPEADVRRMLTRSDEALARGETYIVVFDNTHSGSTPKYLRTAAVDWLKANRDALQEHCLGSALVIRSPALRFVMATVLLMTPHTLEQEVFPTRDAALDWCAAKLRAAGAPVPHGL